MADTFDVSVIIISFNTRDVLRQCLQTVERESEGMAVEIIVVDNASKDMSVEMVGEEFPHVVLVEHAENVGFGAANNAAIRKARGRYVVLLNSDAFLEPGALRLAVEHMDATPRAGVGGARLVSADGSWQPSAHEFPSVWLDFLMISGLQNKYSKSRMFGRMDRSWDDSMQAAKVDWVTGAFLIVRPEALQKAGPFDEEFFLYFEEVDLCRRFKLAGYEVWYWPDIVVVHLGGESAKGGDLEVSRSGTQVMLWHMRSSLIYYRKYHGVEAWWVMMLERFWYWMRAIRNERSSEPWKKERAKYCRTYKSLMEQAWRETYGGRISPPRPW